MTPNQLNKKQLGSISWFRKVLANKTGDPTINDQIRKVSNVHEGRMYGYFYEPKGKVKMDYYDAYPLVLVLAKYNDGFLGINFHYLPHMYRTKLRDLLTTKTKNVSRRGKAEQIIRTTYRILELSKINHIMNFSIKRYLYSHVKSRFTEFLLPNAFQHVIYLPTESFTKATKTKVWADARSAIKSNKR